MKSAHSYPWTLPSKTWTAGASDVIEGKLLPKMLFGGIAHVSSLQPVCEWAPTYTTAPNTIGNNGLYMRYDFFDGQVNRFTGDWRALRTSERLMAGQSINADPDEDTASTAQRVTRRTLHMGPVNYAGNPSDFLFPCGALDNAEVRMTCGALTDLSADTTAVTGTTRTTADLRLLPAEVRIPPVWERKTQSVTGGDAQLQGRALYDYIALTDTDYSVFAAGEIATVNVDLGEGLVVPGINARDLVALYLADRRTGDLGNVMGEPSAAGDDNVKQVNRAAVTAVVGSTANLQPLLWSPLDAYINKRPMAASSAHIWWTGTDTAVICHTSKLLPQSKPAVGAMIAKAFSKLPFTPKNARVKTLSKDAFASPFVEFMPWVVDV